MHFSLGTLGRQQAAADLKSEVCQLRKAGLGPQHPDTSEFDPDALSNYAFFPWAT